MIAESERIAMNAELFRAWSPEQYARLSPHIAHSDLRKLWGRMVASACRRCLQYKIVPNVLDLGAGDGFSCRPFLDMGAPVTAVDCSVAQLLRLREIHPHSASLRIVKKSAEDYLSATKDRYDIVIASSFLHHVPDYLSLISRIVEVLNTQGQVLFFQDPLRYDTQPKLTRLFDVLAYAGWRLFQPDVVGGIKRRFRRMRGIYLDDCPEDHVEYHVMRNGVDQEAVVALLREKGFSSEVSLYWSQQSIFFQGIGALLRLRNSFGVHAILEGDI